MLGYTLFVSVRFSRRYYIARRSNHESQRNRKRLVADLSGGVGVLKAIASTAPFLGLAGTCYGILDGLLFGNIAMEKRAALALISASVASALVTTAAGLLVAIPAAVSCNVLRTRIESFRFDAWLSRENQYDAQAGLRSVNFAQSLPFQSQFSGFPAFALIASPCLAVIVAIFMLFEPYETPTGLSVKLAQSHCKYESNDRVIVLRIADSGKVFINFEAQDWNSLSDRLSQIYSPRANRTLDIVAEDGVPFQTVAYAIDLAKNAPVPGTSDPLNITARLITSSCSPEPVRLGPATIVVR
jgi:biopolymer transport protein ExbD